MTGGFRVLSKPCPTCIFRKDSPLDLDKLLKDVTDRYGFLSGHRVCHHTGGRTGVKNACCRGFWNMYKDDFQMGQVAQRLGFVEEIDLEKSGT